MPKKKYTSGNPNATADCYVEFFPAKSGRLITDVQSKTLFLHGSKLDLVIRQTLTDLGIKHGKITVIDNGGQYFVRQARIEAAVKIANPKLERESLDSINEHALYKSTRGRFRRSRLYIPGNQAKLMLNAGIHKPDAIILDLEDSVPFSEKYSARLIVRNALRHLDFFGAERMVRINQGKTGMTDLEAVIPHNVHLILVPKVEEAKQLKDVDDKIQEICKKCGRKDSIYLMPILENASGILNSLEIAQASENNVAIAIGLEDYTADIGVQRTNMGKESLFARCQVINAARSAGIQAIDTVFSDVNDIDGLRASLRESRELGFDGKGCIHPRQIRPTHDEFAPTVLEIEKAKEIVLAFDKAKTDGLGVVSLGNKMIDPPVVRRAQHTINLAVIMDLIPIKWKQK